MTNTPYPAPTPITDPTTVALWASYERAARRAADQYIRVPISLDRLGETKPCATCTRPTVSRYGVCRRCRQGERRAWSGAAS